jgi:drug/metabolite transporter (DMT)-like permease
VWLALALVAAVSTAAKETLIKVAMRDTDEYVIVLVMSAVTAAVLTPAALALGHAPTGRGFWLALLVSGGINVTAALLIARAVHVSDLSLVSPLQSLTPLFMLAVSPMILAEWASAPGLLGVLAMVTGSYVVSISARGDPDIVRPFARLLRDTGARLMLAVAFLFSISASVDKVGVLASGPLTWGAALHAFVAAALAPVVLLRRGRPGRGRGPGPAAGRPGGSVRPFLLLATGAVVAVGVAAQMTALTMTLATYVIGVKRTSTLISVAAGRVVFGESQIRLRLAGAALLLAGFVLLGLA